MANTLNPHLESLLQELKKITAEAEEFRSELLGMFDSLEENYREKSRDKQPSA